MSGVSPEQQFKLTVDFPHSVPLARRMADHLGEAMPPVKLGPLVVMSERFAGLRRYLRAHGISTGLDAKHMHNADQMGALVQKDSSHGFQFTTVALAAGVQCLIAAGQAQDGIRVVAALSSGDEALRRIELGHLRSANAELDEEQKITRVMCNVGDIERAKELGDLLVCATGIRMPGDHAHDQPMVATPRQALARGADILALGRAVTEHDDPLAAYQQIVESVG